jgi:hypothetical protein
MLKSNTNNNELILFQVTTAEKVKKKKKTQKNDFNQSFSFTDQVITYKMCIQNYNYILFCYYCPPWISKILYVCEFNKYILSYQIVTYSKNKQVSDEALHWGLRKNMKEVDIKDSGIEKSKDM